MLFDLLASSLTMHAPEMGAIHDKNLIRLRIGKQGIF